MDDEIILTHGLVEPIADPPDLPLRAREHVGLAELDERVREHLGNRASSLASMSTIQRVDPSLYMFWSTGSTPRWRWRFL
jgi:hypothetical protein